MLFESAHFVVSFCFALLIAWHDFWKLVTFVRFLKASKFRNRLLELLEKINTPFSLTLSLLCQICRQKQKQCSSKGSHLLLCQPHLLWKRSTEVSKGIIAPGRANENEAGLFHGYPWRQYSKFAVKRAPALTRNEGKVLIYGYSPFPKKSHNLVNVQFYPRIRDNHNLIIIEFVIKDYIMELEPFPVVCWSGWDGKDEMD